MLRGISVSPDESLRVDPSTRLAVARRLRMTEASISRQGRAVSFIKNTWWHKRFSRKRIFHGRAVQCPLSRILGGISVSHGSEYFTAVPCSVLYQEYLVALAFLTETKYFTAVPCSVLYQEYLVA